MFQIEGDGIPKKTGAEVKAKDTFLSIDTL